MISLHAICGRESVHAERFIRAFAPAVDEICLARAVGSSEPDDTIEICGRVAAECRVDFRFAEYVNKVEMPHVDDFAAARNLALGLCRGEVILWADFDDIISPETAKGIRQLGDDLLSGDYKYERLPGQPEVYEENGLKAAHVFCPYVLRTQGQSAMRERIFTRSCHPVWRGCIHENLVQQKPAIRLSAKLDWQHQPLENHGKDAGRNLRILRAATEMADHHVFERARQEFIDQGGEPSKDSARYLEWALGDPQMAYPRRYQAMVMLAHTLRKNRPERAKDLLWQAIRLMPEQRDAYALIAEIELADRKPSRALCAWLSAIAQRRPAPSGYQISEHLYRWTASDILCRCRRAMGEDPDPELAKMASRAGGYRIALLHATRGRHEKAMRARQVWHEAAHKPEQIYHIFASDADDPSTAELQASGARVLINPGASCVSAWNLAAEHAAGLGIPVMVQLSDDWTPCMDWDFHIWETLKDAAKGSKVGKTPMVLRVNDGTRNDALMCMAILTLARWRDQGQLFAPEYFGVYSDNEFSWRAQKDGVVVDGTSIHFRHAHPAFNGKGHDATYDRQNDPERYREGKEIFWRRNPDCEWREE